MDMYNEYEKSEVFEILLKYEDKYLNDNSIYDLIIYINECEEYVDEMKRISKKLNPEYL